MIFDINNSFDVTESYKERNLYYKIFAGYLLNEIVVGYEKRKQNFIELVETQINKESLFFGDKNSATQIISKIKTNAINVTFDYHPAQIFPEDKINNRGEMSDILILSNSEMLSIECKFLSNINYDKDITEVQERIIKFSNKFSLKPIQILLLKENKWRNTIHIKEKLKTIPQVPVVVVFWEQILSLIDNEIVKTYLQKQVDRKSKESILIQA